MIASSGPHVSRARPGRAGEMPTQIVYVGPECGWQSVGAVVGAKATLSRAEPTQQALARALLEADALVDAAIRIPVTEAMVAASPRLMVVSCASTGADHIARGELTRRGGIVRTLREAPEVIRDLTPAAELSFALLLACARKLIGAVAHVKAGNWEREQFPGLMLNGKQLGLLGCGRIGSWMARYGQAFGMQVVGHDPYVLDLPLGVRRIPVVELVATSDAVSVHVPLTAATTGLLSAELIGQLKPGAILINTSRGAIIDEAALLSALSSGRIGAAGLDVLDGEPTIAHHPLLTYARGHDNLLITPHCGGFSFDALARVCAHAARVALQLLGAD